MRRPEDLPRNRKLGRIKSVVGWREWVALPPLGVDRIKAKFDTGAKTSALHAFDIQPFQVNGEDWVRFNIHPLQLSDSQEKSCVAKVVDRRWVTNPGGRRQKRIIITTDIRLGDAEWPIELSLTDRDEMGFRMLIGRTAMHGRLVVDPDGSYRAHKSKKTKRKKKKSEPGARKTTKLARRTSGRETLGGSGPHPRVSFEQEK